jgi:hypothetical protein
MGGNKEAKVSLIAAMPANEDYQDLEKIRTAAADS